MKVSPSLIPTQTHHTRRTHASTRSANPNLGNVKRFNGESLGASQPQWLRLLLGHVNVANTVDIMNTTLNDILFNVSKPFILDGNLNSKGKSRAQSLADLIVHSINEEFGSRLTRDITFADIYQMTPARIKQLFVVHGPLLPLSEHVPVRHTSCI